MATLVKEKRREKKKSKEKHASKKEVDLVSSVTHLSLEDQPTCQLSPLNIRQNETINIDGNLTEEGEKLKNTEEISKQVETITNENKVNIEDVSHEDELSSKETPKINVNNESSVSNTAALETSIQKDNVAIPCNISIDKNNEKADHSANESFQCIETSSPEGAHKSNLYGCLKEEIRHLETEQDMIPSAPALEAPIVSPIPQTMINHINVEVTKPKTQCMPLEEAIRVYGGKEIAEVKAMSEREEALVEGGPVSGPEHPLVDLLSNFRLSLTAVEREKAQISYNLIEEEKARLKLWKIEKRSINVSEKCQCGASVDFKAVFDHAELLKEKLPAARMRLQAILRDVQESYCHHQHAALMAHCQIEHLISETVRSNKSEIREALSLVLQALRLSDGAADSYPRALERWASALAAALVDERDLRDLLFLLHHLFRQTRSVRWAARAVRLSVSDAWSAARALAVLDLLLTRPGLDTAVECTEELETWEEVDVRGGAGAVGEGRLRERDLCALLAALPLRALLARFALFARQDVRTSSAAEWGDASGGHGVLKCCCGARALLDVLARARRAHPAYARLHAALGAVASALTHALADLHAHTSPLYAAQLQERISCELQACFVGALELGGAPDRLPAGLLEDAAAAAYCDALIHGLHDNTPRRIEALGTDAPVVSCEVRVRSAAQAAVDRRADRALARTVLEFLLQTGVGRKQAPCAGACAAEAARALARVLAAHRYLHTAAFELLADLSQAEAAEAAVARLCPAQWRPSAPELGRVLELWERRCPQLVGELLALLDYTPHSGLSLETQLSLGAWLCARAGARAWRWAALRRLRVHRAHWRLPLHAPPPNNAGDLYRQAYALLASAWGHCIPLACGPGAEALCRLAAERPEDALHCLLPVMRLMALSPESVSYTPKFGEALTLILSAGPSLVRRALGRGGLPAHERLQRALLAQLAECDASEAPALLSAWLHALWRPALPASAGAVADAAVRAARLHAVLDAHVAALLQEENGSEYVADAVRNASAAPLLCEAALRGAHALELRANKHALLLDALAGQRAAAQRIHVDNALKQIGSSLVADELAVHRAGVAALAAPLAHPAHLALWRLLVHIYLQRPPSAPQEENPPVGPLFFSGIVKTRVMYQLKKKLQETAAYHQRQAELLKTSPIDSRPPQRPARREKSSPSTDTNIFPSLSMADLTGERSSDSGSDGEDEETAGNDASAEPQQQSSSQDTFNMICYHSAAEKMVREYARWLEEGERTHAAPHHADIARFIPEQALDTAWRLSVPQATFPETPTAPPPGEQQAAFDSVDAQLTHHERAVRTILSVKSTAGKRTRTASLSAPLCDSAARDMRSLLQAVDKLLADLQKLTQDWSSEVRYISKLDGQLWELVCALRVRRALPPVAKSCARGCKPTTVRVQDEEWCISTGAERGIQENRRSAQAALRRLARARPDAARTAAALLYVARGVRDAQSAVRVAERAAQCADALDACALAKQALTALVSDLAERWVCGAGDACAALVRAWCGAGGARAALCGPLLAPRRLPPADLPALYAAVLAAPLPPHAAFSYLSKFEVARWSERADTGQRWQVLEALLAAAQASGASPPDSHQVLLELHGVHACAVVTARELCAHVCASARAAAAGRLPPAYFEAVARAAETHAASVPFDQLGHVQRDLGAIWWGARADAASQSRAQYAAHAARLLRALQRAFVAAARALSHTPDAVAVYAWSSIRESWGPWVTPHPSPPLLPSIGDEEEAYTGMLDKFVDTLLEVMELCPGSDEALLRCVWEWAVRAWLAVCAAAPGAQGGQGGQEARVQLSALLAALVRLPWDCAWWSVDCLALALQAVSTRDKELSAWCARAWRGVAAGAWLRGAAGEARAPALAALLALFTSAHVQHAPQTLSEACALPWERLPEAALDEALQRFFVEHYSTALPYHDCPQFQVVLAASELRAAAGAPVSLSWQSRDKRAHCLSQWVRAAAAPALAPHVRAHAHAALAVIAALAPHIEQSPGELEELLSRAIIIMCMEAAAAALPVWQQWVAGSGRRLRAACAGAVAGLTAPDYFAALAEAVARAHLADREGSGWTELRARWSQCAWCEGAALATRGAVHAAYGALLARAHADEPLRAAFRALADADLLFDCEPMIAVWICAACRYARGGGEGGAAARALLARWVAEPRRSLLRLVALQPAPAGPTPRHRLLCNLALCIVGPDEASARAFEASCGAVLGPAAGDVASWASAPRPSHLARLALRLYPSDELYFREEVLLATDDH